MAASTPCPALAETTRAGAEEDIDEPLPPPPDRFQLTGRLAVGAHHSFGDRSDRTVAFEADLGVLVILYGPPHPNQHYRVNGFLRMVGGYEIDGPSDSLEQVGTIGLGIGIRAVTFSLSYLPRLALGARDGDFVIGFRHGLTFGVGVFGLTFEHRATFGQGPTNNQFAALFSFDIALMIYRAVSYRSRSGRALFGGPGDM